jgi:phenylalanyl-tRNA synthetase alpha chain
MVLPARPSNIPLSVWSRMGRNLHQIRTHPVGIVSSLIQGHFKSLHGGSVFDSAPLPPTPIVTVEQAFDNLLVPKDHVLRSSSDTYYVSERTVLRPHATSHQLDVLKWLRTQPDRTGAVWTCDVYRKDEVDRIHFPVFHQTDGVRVFENSVSESSVVSDLQQSLEGSVTALFEAGGRRAPAMRWDHSAYFPFTHPSMELEIENADGVWVECLGCGKIRTEIDPNGWAFGIGIDRLAMLLFEIDDIRTLWSQDERFLSQFTENKITKFKPFSKYPPTTRDIAFWLPSDSEWDIKGFVFEVMSLAGPRGLERIELIDEFTHPKTGRNSKCLRLTYRGIEKTLTSEEANDIHSVVESFVRTELRADIR